MNSILFSTEIFMKKLLHFFTVTRKEKGYTTYTCECGDSYVDAYVDGVATPWVYKKD